MLAGDSAALRKARGAFFTPPQLCQHVADWAIRKPGDAVLEPSCGEAAFLVAAAKRLRVLEDPTQRVARPRGFLAGIELHDQSAAAARALVAEAGCPANISVGDFLDLEPAPRYDAVVGNPPYVRYQEFSGMPRVRARQAALRAGVALTRLASSWAAFVVHAALFLKPEGRLGLVLPAELLTVNYASEVRSFLLRRFAKVRLVLFEERVFPGVLEEVVLLLAEGEGPTDHFELQQVRDLAKLAEFGSLPSKWTPATAAGKWTPALMPSEALEAYLAVQAPGSFSELQAWGETTLGMVTGNNRYFALSQARANELRLAKSDVIRMSPPGSRHLRGLTFTDATWAELTKAGSATYLFRPMEEPSAAAIQFIDAGEQQGIHGAYKCRVRRPWWRVPLVPPADLLLTYMNADTPRLCTNRAGVRHLNSVHGVYLRSDQRTLGMDLLPIASLNTITLLGAETVGRAYGGGLLKLEPKEADRLPVPSPDLVAGSAAELRALRPQLSVALRNGRLHEAVAAVDRVLLAGALGMSRAQTRALEEAHAGFTARRVARNTRPRGAY